MRVSFWVEKFNISWDLHGQCETSHYGKISFCSALAGECIHEGMRNMRAIWMLMPNF